MSSQAGSGQGNWHLKRVESSTGPLHGTALSSAIRAPASVPGLRLNGMKLLNLLMRVVRCEVDLG